MSIQSVGKRGKAQWLSIFASICVISLWTSVNLTYAQNTAKKNFLWSLKTDKATIYLLGSLHLLTSDSYPLDRNIETAYRMSKKIVFETDISGMNTLAVQEKLLALSMYPEGQTLQQNISPETYSMLEKKLTEIGLSVAQLNNVRPWMCALTLVLFELQKLGFEPQYGIDQYFFKKTQQDKKEMVFLESIEYQLSLFADMNAQEDESFLQQTLKDLEVIKTMFADILSAWEEGDAARLGSLLNISFKDHPDIYNRFLAQRNREWVAKIEDLIMQGNTAFVVVGAGHLVGPDNLLQLLRGRGYAIEQITAHVGAATFPRETLADALDIRLETFQ
jgi:uncharacterized protein